MAEVQLTKVREAKVNRHQRNGERGEELQYARGEKRQTQHFHGAAAEILRGFTNIIRLCRTAAKNAQRLHSAQAVEKVAAQAGQRLEVATVSIGGTHAYHRHKGGDQRGRGQQDQCRNPVKRENDNHNQQRHAHRQRHLREVAGVVVVHIVNLLKDQRGPAASRSPLDPGGPSLLQAVEHLAADLIPDVQARVKADALAQPDHPGAQDKHQHQLDKRQQQRLARNIFHDQVVENARQQPGLGDNQQTASQAQQA